MEGRRSRFFQLRVAIGIAFFVVILLKAARVLQIPNWIIWAVVAVFLVIDFGPELWSKRDRLR